MTGSRFRLLEGGCHLSIIDNSIQATAPLVSRISCSLGGNQIQDFYPC